jgi:hypothetical protein
VVPVIWFKTALFIVAVQSVCLDLNCNVTLCWMLVLALLIPSIEVCVWVLGSFRRCTHFSVMKCVWDPLSRSARHGTYWPVLSLISTTAVANITWFLGFPFKVWQVVSSSPDWSLVVAGELTLLVVLLLVVTWFCLAMCNRVWCLLWQMRHLLWTCVTLHK